MGKRAAACGLALTGLALLALAGCGSGGSGVGSPGAPQPRITVSITGPDPLPTSVASGASVQFDATVTGSSDTAVNWTVSPAAAGGVTAAGLFTAAVVPSRTPTTLTATAQANGTSSGSAEFSVVPGPAAAPAPDEWTWEGGSSGLDALGVYGTLGASSLGNAPGARVSPAAWADALGNLWLFGGYSFTSSTGVPGNQNDLWEYSDGEWTWVGGSDTIEQPGVYGTVGTPETGNIPGGRYLAVSVTDPSGNFWLFGGSGVDSTGTNGTLNDLWRYSNGEWTWMSGSDTVADYPNCHPGVYGTEGVPAPGNVPGARFNAVGWADPSGNVWLFGGEGYDWNGQAIPVTPVPAAGRAQDPAARGSVGEACGTRWGSGILNDLWKYEPTTGMWTWMSGSNAYNQFGVYGTLGVPSPSNVPGARGAAVTWTDKSGNLWLFGGEGNDVNGQVCQEYAGALDCVLNDLWEYDPSTSAWTWIGGSDVIAQPGVYGTEGVPAASNWPGARWLAVGWTDPSGNFWLFGGVGFDSSGTGAGFAELNDLWKYDPTSGEWTWMSGSDIANQSGAYGTLGVAAPSTVPGARDSAAGWTDPAGNLWLFGGQGAGGKLNDLWKYQPPNASAQTSGR